MSLYLKYRPLELDMVLGNKATIASLQSTIARKEHPHVYLFHGASGCGKTTLARITAKGLGCSNNDIIELNAANFRGIETAREIIQQMRLAPLSGNKKAWIIDEAHQLTKDGQSALLKALEDTPKHVYFLLATTDPQKLLVTVKNRCSKFELKPLSEINIICLLSDIAKKEQVKIPEAVLDSIAEKSEGSPRAAIVLLEGVIDLPENKMLKAIAKAEKINKQVIDLCRALIGKNKWKEIATILKDIATEDPENVRLAVLGYCKTVLLNGENGRAFLIMDSFKEPFYNTGHAGLVRACYEAVFE